MGMVGARGVKPTLSNWDTRSFALTRTGQGEHMPTVLQHPLERPSTRTVSQPMVPRGYCPAYLSGFALATCETIAPNDCPFNACGQAPGALSAGLATPFASRMMPCALITQ